MIRSWAGCILLGIFVGIIGCSTPRPANVGGSFESTDSLDQGDANDDIRDALKGIFGDDTSPPRRRPKSAATRPPARNDAVEKIVLEKMFETMSMNMVFGNAPEVRERFQRKPVRQIAVVVLDDGWIDREDVVNQLAKSKLATRVRLINTPITPSGNSIEQWLRYAESKASAINARLQWEWFMGTNYILIVQSQDMQHLLSVDYSLRITSLMMVELSEKSQFVIVAPMGHRRSSAEMIRLGIGALEKNLFNAH